MYTPLDQQYFWYYANPQKSWHTAEYWLAFKDIATGPLIEPVFQRELDLMLERHGCIDAPLP